MYVYISGVCVYVSVCVNVIMSVHVYECLCVCVCTLVSVENTQIKQHISKVRVFMLDPQMYLSSSTLAVSDIMISPPWQLFFFPE